MYSFVVAELVARCSGMTNVQLHVPKDESLGAYLALAARAVQAGQMLWPVKPKCHDPWLH